MRQIEEARLELDLGYRFEYLAEFMGFVADAFTATVLSLGLDRDVETRTVRAF